MEEGDVQKYKELRNYLQTIVDSTEQPIVTDRLRVAERLLLWQEKMHTLKINLLFYQKDKIL